jgi:hypothetical protein
MVNWHVRTVALIVGALVRLSTAAYFECSDCKKMSCLATLSADNYFSFTEIQGCSGDNHYCAHVTQNSESKWEIWVDNDGVGCSQVFVVYHDSSSSCGSYNYIEGYGC